MKPIPHRPPVARFITTLLLMLHQPACYGWRPASLEQLTPSQPETMRFTLTNGERLVMVKGRLVDDTLVGRVGNISTEIRLVVARRDVRDVEFQRLDPAATGVFTLAMVALAYGVAALASIASFSGGGGLCC